MPALSFIPPLLGLILLRSCSRSSFMLCSKGQQGVASPPTSPRPSSLRRPSEPSHRVVILIDVSSSMFYSERGEWGVTGAALERDWVFILLLFIANFPGKVSIDFELLAKLTACLTGTHTVDPNILFLSTASDIERSLHVQSRFDNIEPNKHPLWSEVCSLLGQEEQKGNHIRR